MRSAGAAVAGALVTAALQAPATGTTRISVSAARGQEFAGFGLSQPLGDPTFAALDPALQGQALDLAYRALPVRSFRAWVASFAAWDVARMVREFEQSYLDNGLLAKITARCRPKLILAPATTDEGPVIPAADHAAKIAEFLAQLRSAKGLLFEATGILNEPLAFPTSYLAQAAVALEV